MSRWAIAMAAYVVLAGLAYSTLTEKVYGVPLALPVIAFLAFLALRTLLQERRERAQRRAAAAEVIEIRGSHGRE